MRYVLKVLVAAVLAIVTIIDEVRAAHQITVRNRCSQNIWVGTHGDDETPANGGFPLNAGQAKTFGVKNGWTSGRVWGRTGCNSDGTDCESGDCGAGQCRKRTVFDAVTLAEFGLDKYRGLDFWDISLVDGYNLAMSIEPVASTVKSGDKCHRINCKFDFGRCPNDWKQWGRKSGKLAGCKSACSKTKEDRFCCPGWKGYNEQNCPQPTDESRIFKNQCPDAFSYAFDEKTSTFVCESKGASTSSYIVTFCP